MMEQSELKVTGITMIPGTYNGEPCELSFEIIDVKGGVYESTICFDDGLTHERLKQALVEVFSLTDHVAESVNIVSFKIKK